MLSPLCFKWVYSNTSKKYIYSAPKNKKRKKTKTKKTTPFQARIEMESLAVAWTIIITHVHASGGRLQWSSF